MKTLWNYQLVLALQAILLLGCTAGSPLNQANVVSSLSNNLARIQSSFNGFPNQYTPQPIAARYYNYPTQPVYYYTPVSYQTTPRTIRSTVAKAATKKTPAKIISTAVKPSYPTVGHSVSSSLLLAEVGVRARFVSASALARPNHPSMKPTYITIHSTGSTTMNANEYASAMSRGLRSRLRPGASRAGRLSWHFTVDSAYAIQHLSTHVQGGHADFNGLGNTKSIGIEMCEYRGINLGSVMDRTAKLAAYLMWKHQIPLSHVVPHYHWPRPGVTPYRKACPHFLMDNGRPGAKWAAFQNRVLTHYQRLQAPVTYVMR